MFELLVLPLGILAAVLVLAIIRRWKIRDAIEGLEYSLNRSEDFQVVNVDKEGIFNFSPCIKAHLGREWGDMYVSFRVGLTKWPIDSIITPKRTSIHVSPCSLLKESGLKNFEIESCEEVHGGLQRQAKTVETEAAKGILRHMPEKVFLDRVTVGDIRVSSGTLSDDSIAQISPHLTIEEVNLSVRLPFEVGSHLAALLTDSEAFRNRLNNKELTFQDKEYDW